MGMVKVLEWVIGMRSDHEAAVEFRLLCKAARRGEHQGHPLHAFGADGYDLRRQQIESFLTPCHGPEAHFRPHHARRQTLQSILSQLGRITSNLGLWVERPVHHWSQWQAGSNRQ